MIRGCCSNYIELGYVMLKLSNSCFQCKVHILRKSIKHTQNIMYTILTSEHIVPGDNSSVIHNISVVIFKISHNIVTVIRYV